MPTRQKPKAKPKAKAAPVPKVPEDIASYLRNGECCNRGIVMLHNFISNNDPVLVVRAIKAVMAPRLRKAKAAMERQVKERMAEMENAKEEIEAITGKPVVITM